MLHKYTNILIKVTALELRKSHLQPHCQIFIPFNSVKKHNAKWREDIRTESRVVYVMSGSRRVRR